VQRRLELGDGCDAAFAGEDGDAGGGQGGELDEPHLTLGVAVVGEQEGGDGEEEADEDRLRYAALVIGGADGAEVGLGEEVGQKGERQRDGADDELGGVVVDLQAFGFRPGVGSRSFGGTIYCFIVL